MRGWRVHFVSEPWDDTPSRNNLEAKARDCEAKSALCGKVCFQNPGTGEGTGSNQRDETTCKRCLAKL